VPHWEYVLSRVGPRIWYRDTKEISLKQARLLHEYLATCASSEEGYRVVGLVGEYQRRPWRVATPATWPRCGGQWGASVTEATKEGESLGSLYPLYVLVSLYVLVDGGGPPYHLTPAPGTQYGAAAKPRQSNLPRNAGFDTEQPQQRVMNPRKRLGQRFRVRSSF